MATKEEIASGEFEPTVINKTVNEFITAASKREELAFEMRQKKFVVEFEIGIEKALQFIDSGDLPIQATHDLSRDLAGVRPVYLPILQAILESRRHVPIDVIKECLILFEKNSKDKEKNTYDADGWIVLLKQLIFHWSPEIYKLAFKVYQKEISKLAKAK